MFITGIIKLKTLMVTFSVLFRFVRAAVPTIAVLFFGFIVPVKVDKSSPKGTQLTARHK